MTQPENIEQRAETTSVAEAARRLGISSRTLYEAIQRGEFVAIKVRTRIRIPTSVLNQLLQEGNQ